MKYDINSIRYEYKFLIPNENLSTIHSLIRPYVINDKYMDLCDNNGYIVRSIYFDTPGYAFYHEKKEGFKVRKKVRIRGYNDFDPENIVFLEIKRKKGKSITKNRVPVKFKNIGNILTKSSCLEQFVITDNGFDHAVDDARRFLFHMNKYCLQPTVLVIYRREAYFGKYDRNLRLTLDKELRGAIHPDLDSLYEENNIKYSIPDHSVFEVKFYDKFPVWLKKITALLSLKLESFSKFTTCIEEQIEIDKTSRQMIQNFVHALWF